MSHEYQTSLDVDEYEVEKYEGEDGVFPVQILVIYPLFRAHQAQGRSSAPLFQVDMGCQSEHQEKKGLGSGIDKEDESFCPP